MQSPQVLFPYSFSLTLKQTRVLALEPILSVAFSGVTNMLDSFGFGSRRPAWAGFASSAFLAMRNLARKIICDVNPESYSILGAWISAPAWWCIILLTWPLSFLTNVTWALTIFQKSSVSDRGKISNFGWPVICASNRSPSLVTVKDSTMSIIVFSNVSVIDGCIYLGNVFLY